MLNTSVSIPGMPSTSGGIHGMPNTSGGIPGMPNTSEDLIGLLNTYGGMMFGMPHTSGRVPVMGAWVCLYVSMYAWDGFIHLRYIRGCLIHTMACLGLHHTSAGIPGMPYTGGMLGVPNTS